MPDFFQNGTIATLHRLVDRPLSELTGELDDWRRERPMTLIIPCLYSELAGPALSNIVDQLAEVSFLEEIVIGLDGADADQFAEARRFFARLPQRTRILWNDGPRMVAIQDELGTHGLAPRQPGKGRNVWYCLGYFLASGRGAAVALHDADITTYDPALVARLLYPVVHPSFDYAFCKGFYFRSSDGRLNGRVTRLLVTPLIRALRKTIGPSGYLDFLDSFRYPLAGEVSMRSEVVPTIRIPADWGLEIGMLSEVHRHYAANRICQVDIAGAYDHKHQSLSAEDPTQGLHKMSIDIAKAMLRKLATDGVVFTPEGFRTIKAAYYRTALGLVDHYHNDAVLNGLTFDRHDEEGTVEVFAQSIMTAGEKFLSNPMETPFIANWSRVMSAVPTVLETLDEAVEADNA